MESHLLSDIATSKPKDQIFLISPQPCTSLECVKLMNGQVILKFNLYGTSRDIKPFPNNLHDHEHIEVQNKIKI